MKIEVKNLLSNQNHLLHAIRFGLIEAESNPSFREQLNRIWDDLQRADGCIRPFVTKIKKEYPTDESFRKVLRVGLQLFSLNDHEERQRLADHAPTSLPLSTDSFKSIATLRETLSLSSSWKTYTKDRPPRFSFAFPEDLFNAVPLSIEKASYLRGFILSLATSPHTAPLKEIVNSIEPSHPLLNLDLLQDLLLTGARACSIPTIECVLSSPFVERLDPAHILDATILGTRHPALDRWMNLMSQFPQVQSFSADQLREFLQPVVFSAQILSDLFQGGLIPKKDLILIALDLNPFLECFLDNEDISSFSAEDLREIFDLAFSNGSPEWIQFSSRAILELHQERVDSTLVANVLECLLSSPVSIQTENYLNLPAAQETREFYQQLFALASPSEDDLQDLLERALEESPTNTLYQTFYLPARIQSLLFRMLQNRHPPLSLSDFSWQRILRSLFPEGRMEALTTLLNLPEASSHFTSQLVEQVWNRITTPQIRRTLLSYPTFLSLSPMQFIKLSVASFFDP